MCSQMKRLVFTHYTHHMCNVTQPTPIWYRQVKWRIAGKRFRQSGKKRGEKTRETSRSSSKDDGNSLCFALLHESFLLELAAAAAED